MKWITGGMLLLLLVPAVAAYQYSTSREPLELVFSLLSISLYAGAVSWLALHMASRPLRAIFLFLMVGLMLVYQYAYFLANYFLGEGFGDAFFYHLRLDAVLETWRVYSQLSIPAGLCVMALMLLAWFGSRQPTRNGRFVPAIAIIVVALLADPEIRRLSTSALRHGQLAEPLNQESIQWQQLGLDREALSTQPGEVGAGKNLLLIYMEGLEQIYTEESIFPGLTPNLNRMAEEGLQFTNIHQASGAEWTVGGMVASLCGTPLLAEDGVSGNSILFNQVLDRAVCMGDVLDRAGYRQQYMGGASTEFAGKGPFLQAHGYDRVLGREQLLQSLEDPGYRSGWGLYDDSTFELASEEFRRLADQQSPFNLTLLTLDTHHPDGFPSRSCPAYEAMDNSMLDAVHCSDYLIERFLNDIDDHPAYDDTLVVLISDHLSMRNNAHPLFPDDYPRRLFFTVLNGGRSGTVDTPGIPMDMAPTVLRLMDVEHDVAFLAGTDLLDDGAGQRPTDFNAPQRLRALRYINSNHLSSQGRAPAAGVCERPVMLVGQQALQLGSHRLPLVEGGVPIEAEQLRADRVVTASVDNSRAVDRSIITTVDEWLDAVASEQATRSMLLVGRHEQLKGLVPLPRDLEIPADHVLVAIGERGQRFHVLGSAPEVSELRVSPGQCQQVFDQADL